jgi:hypothetical protein
MKTAAATISRTTIITTSTIVQVRISVITTPHVSDPSGRRATTPGTTITTPLPTGDIITTTGILTGAILTGMAATMDTTTGVHGTVRIITAETRAIRFEQTEHVFAPEETPVPSILAHG